MVKIHTRSGDLSVFEGRLLLRAGRGTEKNHWGNKNKQEVEDGGPRKA